MDWIIYLLRYLCFTWPLQNSSSHLPFHKKIPSTKYPQIWHRPWGKLFFLSNKMFVYMRDNFFVNYLYCSEGTVYLWTSKMNESEVNLSRKMCYVISHKLPKSNQWVNSYLICKFHRQREGKNEKIEISSRSHLITSLVSDTVPSFKVRISESTANMLTFTKLLHPLRTSIKSIANNYKLHIILLSIISTTNYYLWLHVRNKIYLKYSYNMCTYHSF